jgi:hypothetical protein
MSCPVVSLLNGSDLPGRGLAKTAAGYFRRDMPFYPREAGG